MIELDGSGAGSSASAIHFHTGSDSSRVSGLCMNRFIVGVYLYNTKGVQVDGISSLGNGGQGIEIDLNCSGSTIGGTDPGAGNTIAFNTDVGVSVSSSTHIAIQRNSIFSNTGPGNKDRLKGSHYKRTVHFSG